jgi:flagellar biosynthetic protein FliR
MTGPVLYLVAIGKELLIGTLVGFAAVLTFGAAQIAGETMGLSSGFASTGAQPGLGDTSSAIDQLFMMMAMLLFMVLNGHHIFLVALQHTFSLLPVSADLPSLDGQRLMSMTSQLILSGVQMALPVMGALLLTDITLGLLARVAPQVQVFFLGLPLKIGVALIVLSMTFATAAPMLSDLFKQMGPRMLELIAK